MVILVVMVVFAVVVLMGEIERGKYFKHLFLLQSHFSTIGYKEFYEQLERFILLPS